MNPNVHLIVSVGPNQTLKKWKDHPLKCAGSVRCLDATCSTPDPTLYPTAEFSSTGLYTNKMYFRCTQEFHGTCSKVLRSVHHAHSPLLLLLQLHQFLQLVSSQLLLHVMLPSPQLHTRLTFHTHSIIHRHVHEHIMYRSSPLFHKHAAHCHSPTTTLTTLLISSPPKLPYLLPR